MRGPVCRFVVSMGGVWLALVGGAGARAETIRVFAAASLTDAFLDVTAAYEKGHPGDSVELNLAGSQVLRTQIEQGAAADVFAPADLVHAQALAGAGLLGSFQIFARNKLVVVVPATNGSVRALQDLARPGAKIVVAGPGVPAGRYTSQVLDRLTASGLFGPDFRSRVEANIVSHEPNVRAVLSKVALGEADAGFVYVTDARASVEVRPVEIPDRDNVIAEYAIGVVAGSRAPQKAQAFVDVILGAEGQAILRKHGFTVR